MKTKLLPVLGLICLLCIPESIGRPVKYLTLIESSVKFSIRNAGMEVNGSMGGVIADIRFYPEDLTRSHILATADPATIKTGIGIRDKHLKKSDYFDVENFPKIQMKSKAFKNLGTDKFLGKFDLTIRNVTKEIAITFTTTSEANRILYKGSFEMNRLDFNLGERSPILEEDVNVFIQVSESRNN